MPRCSVVFLIALLGACTTAPTRPFITDFASAVQSTTNAVEKRYVRDDLANALANEYDAAIVDRLAFYQAENCGTPIGLSIALDDPALSDFSAHCALTTQEVVDGEIRDVTVEVADGLPGISGEQALRLSNALGAYAEALEALATSESPQQLERDFETAAASVINLADDAKSLVKDGEGFSRTTTRLVDASAGGASSLLRGVFEAKRYRLLHRLVEQSDPAVQLASRALAGWYRAETSGEILGAYEALDAALATHQRAIVALRGGTGSREEAIAATRDVRLAHDQLSMLEAGAPWRVHLAIAEAHAAMLDSFAAPRNLEALARANKRIDNLVGKALKFSEAVKALEQENDR